MPPSPPLNPESVLTRLFDEAVVRGERSAAIIRLVVLGLVLVQILLATEPDIWRDVPERPSIALAFVLVGAVGSVATLVRLRGRERPGLIPWTSVGLDALLVFGIGFPGAWWPRDPYPGQLHFHTLPFFLLAVIGSGMRMSRSVTRFAVAACGAGIAGLLAVDAAKGSAIIPNLASDWILWGACFAGGAALADAIATRTRTLAQDAAAAVLGAERARQALGVYVSEEVAAIALASDALAPGGRRQTAAVLFSDLRGFTRYAERLPPERLVTELNDYLKEMVQVIRAEGGVVDKYIGDAVMAVFGVPREDPDAAARAIRAARRMQEALERHNEARAAAGLPPFKHGIGVHHGPVIVGNIGTAERMQYTVVGDTVNLASRIESATKEVGVPVLVSEAAVEAARASGAPVGDLVEKGVIPIRGREDGVRVYSA